MFKHLQKKKRIFKDENNKNTIDILNSGSLLFEMTDIGVQR